MVVNYVMMAFEVIIIALHGFEMYCLAKGMDRGNSARGIILAILTFGWMSCFMLVLIQTLMGKACNNNEWLLLVYTAIIGTRIPSVIEGVKFMKSDCPKECLDNDFYFEDDDDYYEDDDVIEYR